MHGTYMIPNKMIRHEQYDRINMIIQDIGDVFKYMIRFSISKIHLAMWYLPLKIKTFSKKYNITYHIIT